MIKFRNEEFRSCKGPFFWPSTFSNLEFEGCGFHSCSIGHRRSRDFSRRTIVRDSILNNCRVLTKTFIGPGQFENLQLKNVVGAEVFVLGALFKHVRLSGKFDSLILHGMPDLETPPEDRLSYWNKCDAFYEACDWALDISEAEFFYFENRARAVPASLIRRDPESQAVVRAAEMKNGRWHQLQLGPQIKAQFNRWEFGGQGDFIIVAPKRNPVVYEEVMKDIKALRNSGIAEPN